MSNGALAVKAVVLPRSPAPRGGARPSPVLRPPPSPPPLPCYRSDLIPAGNQESSQAAAARLAGCSVKVAEAGKPPGNQPNGLPLEQCGRGGRCGLGRGDPGGGGSTTVAAGIYQEAFALLPLPSLLLTPDLIVHDANKVYKELTTLGPTGCSEVIGSHFASIPFNRAFANNLETVLENYRSVVWNKQPATVGPFRVLWNGKECYWKVWASPVLVQDDVRFLVCQLEDMTESVNRMNALEVDIRENNLVKLLVSHVKDYAIFMMSPTGHILTWNDGAKRLKQYDESEIVGRHFSVLYLPEDRRDGKPALELRSAHEQGRVEDEGWRLRKDGTMFWASVVITAVYGVHGELVGFAKVTRDLTERRRAEERVVNAHKEASRLKSEFLVNMSHDIRTPMNAVIGMAELLAQTQLTPEQREQVDWIQRCGDALMIIINDILDLSKIEAGKLQIIYEDFALSDLLRDMCTFAEAMLHPKPEVCFYFATTGVDPKLVVLGDRGRLRQVLTNLISNAAKFTDKGEVGFHINAVRVNEDRVRVRFSVTDTGIGIDEQDKAKLFTNFAQVDSSETRRYKGSGLGLAICRRLSALMNGELNFTSKVAEGSDFWLDMNFTVGHKTTVPPGSPSKRKRPRATLSGTVLVVDDNSTNLLVAQRMLEKLGCRVESAQDGVEAVEQVSRRPYDLVFMDVQMPRKSGYDAARDIRAMGKALPIVALTANAMRGDVEKCRAAGMDDYVSKPIRMKDIAEILKKYVSTTEMPVHPEG